MNWKKHFKRVIIAVVVSLVVRTVWLVADREWTYAEGERDFAAAVAVTEMTDPAWSWDSLAAARTIPPAEQNSAALIEQIVDAMPIDWRRDGFPEPSATPDFVTREWPTNRSCPSKRLTESREILSRAPDALKLARTLNNRPYGNRVIVLNPDVLSTTLVGTSHTRKVASLLRWDIIQAVSAHDQKLACDDLLALLNASRSIGDEPFLISQLTRIATRTIATRTMEWTFGQVEMSDSNLVALHAAWIADADAPLLWYGLRGERASYDILLRNLAEGIVTPESINGHLEDSVSFGSYAWWLYRGRFPAQRAVYHRWMSAAVEASHRPIQEQVNAIRALPAVSNDKKMVWVILPAAEKIAIAARRSTAEARCIVVALACERYRLRTGQWPTQLDVLPTDLLPAVPLDPYDGRPLRYKVLPDGVIIYSVWANGIDDGGSLPTRHGIDTGLDDGIRLWNPDQRGLPSGED